MSRAPVKVLVNPMFGSASGIMSQLFSGTKVKIREINSKYDPGFGGINPEPVREDCPTAGSMLVD
ncbi:MAG: hypothetical protein V3S39_02160 [Thermodesulfobacteriota bacterium]